MPSSRILRRAISRYFIAFASLGSSFSAKSKSRNASFRRPTFTRAAPRPTRPSLWRGHSSSAASYLSKAAFWSPARAREMPSRTRLSAHARLCVRLKCMPLESTAGSMPRDSSFRRVECMQRMPSRREFDLRFRLFEKCGSLEIADAALEGRHSSELRTLWLRIPAGLNVGAPPASRESSQLASQALRSLRSTSLRSNVARMRVPAGSRASVLEALAWAAPQSSSPRRMPKIPSSSAGGMSQSNFSSSSRPASRSALDGDSTATRRTRMTLCFARCPQIHPRTMAPSTAQAARN
mmetsp:Transcript_30788/g.56122  ORF Transcript_30788/g.56122 Transcript_30788/m.56122 type:complete len:294 (+) Transcript_30788:94-975(+)